MATLFTCPLPPRLASFRRFSCHVTAVMSYKLPHVLTVAGSDSGAGAGIQADIKACAAMGVYCSSVITAVTAQNTAGVQGVHLIPEKCIEQQLESVLFDMHVDVVKTGMLPSVEIIKILCNTLKKYPVKAIVVDPVMVSTSGDSLSAPSTLLGYRDELFKMADIVTPNLKEASALLGINLETISDMRYAAKSIHKFGPKYVIVKGGDMPGSSDSVDIFFDGENIYELSGPRINTNNTHGTGCTLASCIASELAKGSQMLQAVQAAKAFVERALYKSKNLSMGNGPQGPFDHLFNLKNNNNNISPCNVGPSLRFKDEHLFLYAVTDSGMNKKWGRSIIDAVKAAIKGGATIVQIREKEMETRELIETAKSCIKICRPHKIPLIINDRVDVALASDADGVHLGQSDMSAQTARLLLGPDKILGVSCKTPSQAHQAYVDGANYIGCGGVFDTNTKKGNLRIGIEGLKEVCVKGRLPVVAIGGIKEGNLGEVWGIREGNLKGVAVVSGLFDTECVEGATRRFRDVLDRLKRGE